MSSSKARETFRYLLMFVSLAMTAMAVGGAYFNVIDHFVRDPLAPFGLYQLSALRWQLSAIIVAAPVFFFAARAVKRAVTADPALRRSGMRKWIIYIALFIAAAIMLGDFIGVLARFFDGDLTLRFALNAVTVLTVAGLVFGH
ncbi:hypothetical protein HY573_00475, partial [Candidatus Parcubacteria bacterium]|nr:hypothetical protein [Candidatus Parcubacteria bacterium]